MRPFNKTTATLVRTHPFSTLCPTPLGKSPVWGGGGEAWLLGGDAVLVSAVITHTNIGHQHTQPHQGEPNIMTVNSNIASLFSNQ